MRIDKFDKVDFNIHQLGMRKVLEYIDVDYK